LKIVALKIHKTRGHFRNDSNDSLDTLGLIIIVSPGYRAHNLITYGNGNGKLDPGETVDFVISLKNNGRATASGVNGLLSSGNEYITVNSTSIDYGSLNPDSTGTNLFSVTVAADAPNATPAQFNFDWIADNDIQGTDSFNVIIGQKQVVIINLAAATISPDTMIHCLDILSTPADVVNAVPDNLNDYQCAFVCLGIYSNNHALTTPEGNQLAAYLNDGGRLYMEGGDTWAFDEPTAVHPMFHIIGIDDGSDNLDVMAGDENNFMNSFIFNYIGANNYMDEITTDDTSKLVFTNLSPVINTAISFENGTYKTIGATFEFGGLADNETCNKAGYMAEILSFFDVNFLWTDISHIKETHSTMMLYPNPASNQLTVQFTGKQNNKTTISVYDMAGRVVSRQQFSSHQGVNNASLYIGNLKNGIYFVEVNINGNPQMQKLVITK